MATDATKTVDSSAPDATEKAFVTPTVDFLLIVSGTLTLAFAGAAVLSP